MKVFVAVIAVLLSCSTGTLGTTTLVATHSASCVAGTNSIPVTGTVTLACTATTATVSAVQGENTVSIQFKKGGTLVFELAETTADLQMTSADTTNFPVGNLAATASDKTLTVVVSSFPSDQIASDWTCEVAQSATPGTLSAELSGTGADLTTTCSNAAFLTATCSGTTITATCDAQTATVTQIQNQATAAMKFYKGGSVVFELAEATTDLTMTSGDTTNFPVANLAASIVSNNLQVVITNFPTAQKSTDWSCAVVQSAAGDVANEASAGNLDLTAITCGAGMNQIAGLLVALLVTMKILLF